LPFWWAAPSLDAVGWSALIALGGSTGRGLLLLCGRDPPRPRDRCRARAGDRADPLPLWVALAFGEWPSHWALLGGAIVVGAVTARGVLGPRG
jgi:hypothetical protein